MGMSDQEIEEYQADKKKALKEEHRRARLPIRTTGKHWDGAKIIDPKSIVKIARNEKCPCNSGLKYKKCCGGK